MLILITGHNIHRGYGTFVVYYFVSHTIYVVDKYILQCAVILVVVVKGMNYSIFFKF